DLQYWHRAEGQLLLIGVFALILLLLLVRSLLSRRPRPHRLVGPALLGALRAAPGSIARHGPVVLFVARVPLFTLAVADPCPALARREVACPGRRVTVMIDASTSMRTPFKAQQLNRRAETDATFFTAVAAAERFLRLRINGKYRDLVALVEFGNEA